MILLDFGKSNQRSYCTKCHHSLTQAQRVFRLEELIYFESLIECWRRDSTGGIVSLSGGGQLSGTGNWMLAEVQEDGWVLGGDFVKSSGTLTISQTDLKLDKAPAH